MQRIRIKICGITRLSDALIAAQQGVDALGFVFYEPSPRHIDIATAADIMRQLPAFVTTVALFVDPDKSYVEQVVAATQVDLLQFHGDESAAFCDSFSRPYIKALRIRPDHDISSTASEYSGARALLLDTYVANIPGGTGKVFDWNLIPPNATQPLVLAGGLTPENITQAAQQPGIWGVDVSGGVEVSKGVKSPALIESFCKGVNGG